LRRIDRRTKSRGEGKPRNGVHQWCADNKQIMSVSGMCCLREIAGGEAQRVFLIVQVGKFGFEFDERMVGAGNIARATGADAMARRSPRHRFDYLGMASHAEIIVGAPDDDFFRADIRTMPEGVGETVRIAFDIGENAIALFRPQLADRALEEIPVVHDHTRSATSPWPAPALIAAV
jgi:hypothetical protein